MRKAYYGADGAQIHCREWGAAPRSGGSLQSPQSPLFLLPPAPHSSLYFTKIAPLLAETRPVIAVDYPGYGGSDYQGEHSIDHYAATLLPLLPQDSAADLLGFHSGCLVAYELARQAKERASHLIMVDVPLFDDVKRNAYAAAMPAPSKIPVDISGLAAGFEKNVGARLDDLGAPRAFALWTESLRAGEMKNAAFQAAFAYDTAREFLTPPAQAHIHVIATESSLLEPSRRAAKIIPRAHLTECLDINRAVMDVFAVTMTEKINSVLQGE